MNDHYSILGVGRQATTAEIANAYRQLLLRERQDKGDQADFGIYSLAYRTLTNPSKRAEYDRFLDELSGKYVVRDAESPSEAEKCYLAGLTCMEQKNFQDAVDYLYRAVQLESDNSHFCSQLGLALGMFKDRLAEAERYCKKAINLDPDNPDFRFNLGFLYQRHNLVDAAQTAFDLANEAIRSREARLLRENEPLITPWQEEGQDLLDELSRLETMFDGVGKTEETAPADGEVAPPAEPIETEEILRPPQASAAPEELVTESDLLRQLDELESKASKVELAEALASTASQTEGAMDKFLDDDLLKELDLLEAQVRGVEELHNDEQTKAAESLAAELLATLSESPAEGRGAARGEPEPAAPIKTVVPQTTEEAREVAPPVPLERMDEGSRLTEMASSEVAEPALNQVDLEATKGQTTAILPSGETTLKLPESLEGQDLSRITLPEALPEPVEPETSAEPAVAEPSTSAAAEPASVQEPIKTIEAAQEPTAAHQLAGAAAGDKIRMLEELEREMLGELEIIRKEKEKLQASV